MWSDIIEHHYASNAWWTPTASVLLVIVGALFVVLLADRIFGFSHNARYDSSIQSRIVVGVLSLAMAALSAWGFIALPSWTSEPSTESVLSMHYETSVSSTDNTTKYIMSGMECKVRVEKSQYTATSLTMGTKTEFLSVICPSDPTAN